MPSREYSEENISGIMSPETLIERLCEGQTSRPLLVMDCRSTTDFTSCHIRGALNVTLPASIIMLRRLSNGKLSIPSLIKDEQRREHFTTLWKEAALVLYDDDLGSSVLTTLLKRLQDEKCTVVCLRGGFNRFHTLYPEWCESENAVTPLLGGLETLRISDSTSETDPNPDSGLGSGCWSAPPFPIEILPNLFLGNATNSGDWESLQKNRIQYVLNVTPNLPNIFEKGKGIKYMQIPIQDHWSQNLAGFFPQAIAFIDEARQKKLGVLVHCLAGISRSVTITLAYLMHESSLSLNDAYDFVRKRKANISPNFNFLGQLQDFERQLNLSSCMCGSQITCLCQKLHFTGPELSPPDSGVVLLTL